MNISKRYENGKPVYTAIKYIDKMLLELVYSDRVMMHFGNTYWFDISITKEEVLKFAPEEVWDFFVEFKNSIDVYEVPKIDSKALKNIAEKSLKKYEYFTFSYCPSFEINNIKIHFLFIRKYYLDNDNHYKDYRIRAIDTLNNKTVSSLLFYFEEFPFTFKDFIKQKRMSIYDNRLDYQKIHKIMIDVFKEFNHNKQYIDINFHRGV